LTGGRATPTRPGELQAVHGARHLDVGKDHGDVRTGFQDLDGLIGISGFDDFEAGGLNHFGRVHSQLVLDDQHHGSFGC
jgi:hypothetical protein